jgi:hypothetical protein
VRANSMVIGFQFRASFGEPADDSGERLAAGASEGNYSDDRRSNARHCAVVDHIHFLSPVIEVFGIV